MSTDQDKTILEHQRAKAGFVFREDVAPGLTLEMSLSRIRDSCTSEFQQVDIIETYFGKTLVTDGKTQSAEFDEFAYHESLVHPALLNFVYRTGRAPKKVFIGGGGELATAREVLRHKQIERCVMVDLDRVVVDFCVKHLPEWGGPNVKSHPKLELIIGDAHQYLLDCKETFDVIIMDISDPIEAGPGIMLYTKELYDHASTLLTPGGVFVTQAGMGDAIPHYHYVEGKGNTRQDSICFGPIRNTLAEVFNCVLPYTQAIPSFGSDWAYVMAYNKNNNNDDKDSTEELKNIDPTKIDELIETYIDGGSSTLKMYDGITHHRMFWLTKTLRQYLSKDKRIMTKDNPVFMY